MTSFCFFSLCTKNMETNVCVFVHEVAEFTCLLRNNNRTGGGVSRHDLRALLLHKREAQAKKRYLIVNHSSPTTFPNIIKVVLKIMLFTGDLEFCGFCISLCWSNILGVVSTRPPLRRREGLGRPSHGWQGGQVFRRDLERPAELSVQVPSLAPHNGPQVVTKGSLSAPGTIIYKPEV